MNLKSQFKQLITKRLILRKPVQQDADKLYLLRTNPEVNQYLDRKPPKSKDDIDELIQKLIKGTDENQWFYWVINTKKSNDLMGTICLWNFNERRPEAEIGFELLPFYQGNGYMSEALITVIYFGFKTLALTKISGWTHPQNQKSIRLMKKSGMEYDGMDRNQVIYSIYINDQKKPYPKTE